MMAPQGANTVGRPLSSLHEVAVSVFGSLPIFENWNEHVNVWAVLVASGPVLAIGWLLGRSTGRPRTARLITRPPHA
jgi:hypothetical protein